MDAPELPANYQYFKILQYPLLGADHNYVAGRCLWFHCAMREAANLLCLAIEQAIKVLIVQKKLEEKSLQSMITKKKFIDDPQYKYDPQENDRIKIDNIINRVFLDLSRDHNLTLLAERLSKENQIDLTQYQATIAKINEYYDLRYYTPGTTSISSKIIDEVDEIYFLLRRSINPPLKQTLFVMSPFMMNFDENFYNYAYHKNKSFNQPVLQHALPATD